MNKQFVLLSEAITSLWINKRLAIIMAWFFCLLGWAVVTLLPDKYESEARVYADTRSILQPLLQGLAIESDPSRELTLLVKTLLSRENLEAIARETDADINADTVEQYEKVLDDLKNNIRMKSLGRDNLFTISYSGKDPVFVRNVVQAVLDTFVENAIGDKRADTDKASAFISEQLKEYEARLAESEAELAEFKRQYIDLMPDKERSYYQRLQELKDDYGETLLKAQELNSVLISTESTLAKELSTGTRTTGGTTVSPFDGQISAMQQRVADLLLRYTEQHPSVVDAKRQLAQLEQQRRDGPRILTGGTTITVNSDYIQELKLKISDTKAELASTEIRAKQMLKDIGDLESKLDQVPQVEAELTGLTRSYDITKAKYEELLARRESAMLSQSVGAASDQIAFRVIDRPRIPLEPSGPMRMILGAMVLVVSCAAGGGLAFVKSQISPVVISAPQLMLHNNIEVYGRVSSISGSSTEKVRRRHNVQCLFLLFGVMVSYLLFIAVNNMELSDIRAIVQGLTI
uniref:XrtA system polysaccharide chain length determinant n=1 Tax=Thaumasiovibrio occultus TaxID=1891184 RepID=UPI000B3501D8|nr:XrtA system polysaccharide chain length determinant [Thaumasiovibrio occultus]